MRNTNVFSGNVRKESVFIRSEVISTPALYPDWLPAGTFGKGTRRQTCGSIALTTQRLK